MIYLQSEDKLAPFKGPVPWGMLKYKLERSAFVTVSISSLPPLVMLTECSLCIRIRLCVDEFRTSSQGVCLLMDGELRSHSAVQPHILPNFSTP